MRGQGYAEYVRGHRKTALLLRAAAGADMPVQPTILQGAVVILAAHFEAFLNSLGFVLADSIDGAWEQMTEPQRRLVAAHVVATLRREFDPISDDAFPDNRQSNRVARRVRSANAWCSVPGDFAANGPELRIRNLYRASVAPDAVDKFVMQLNPTGPRLFDWLDGRGVDRNAMWTTLDQVVRVRNDVAHALYQVPEPTMSEVRTYLARTTRLVRLILEYVAPNAASSSGKSTSATVYAIAARSTDKRAADVDDREYGFVDNNE